MKSPQRRQGARAVLLEYDFSESWFSKGHGFGETQQAVMYRTRASKGSNRPNYTIHVVRIHAWIMEDDEYKPIIIRSCGIRKWSEITE